MLEEIILEKYAVYGERSPNGEIFVPLHTKALFVEECTLLKVAILGIEFFHIQQGQKISLTPLNGIDCSPLLRKYETWQEVVEQCNKSVLRVLEQEEILDNTQYYNPTLLEENDWTRDKDTSFFPDF